MTRRRRGGSDAIRESEVAGTVTPAPSGRAVLGAASAASSPGERSGCVMLIGSSSPLVPAMRRCAASFDPTPSHYARKPTEERPPRNMWITFSSSGRYGALCSSRSTPPPHTHFFHNVVHRFSRGLLRLSDPCGRGRGFQRPGCGAQGRRCRRRAAHRHTPEHSPTERRARSTTAWPTLGHWTRGAPEALRSHPWNLI